MKLFSALSFLPLVAFSSAPFESEDVVDQDVWKSYFQDPLDPSQVECLENLTDESQPSASPPLIVLAFCLTKDRMDTHSKLKNPISYHNPIGFSLVEALFGPSRINKTQKLIIDPLDFVFIWESSHGSVLTSVDIEYSDSFTVPDFEFSTEGNAKAILYALLTVTHARSVDFTLATKLLLSITSECYDEMCKIRGFKGLFEQLCLLKRPAINHFFINANTKNVPRLRDEAKSYCIDHVISFFVELEDDNIDELNCLLAVALKMTPQQIRSINQPLGIEDTSSTKTTKIQWDFQGDLDIYVVKKYVLYEALKCANTPSISLSRELSYFYKLSQDCEDDPFFIECYEIVLKLCEIQSISLELLSAVKEAVNAKLRHLGKDMNNDVSHDEIWKFYFRDSLHTEQVKYLTILTEESPPSAPPSFIALAFCLIKNGEGIHSRFSEPITYNLPKGFSLVEALFGQSRIDNTQKLIIDPLDFIFIWESSHGSDLPLVDIVYSNLLSVPDFEFSTAGNAKAILYALLTVSHAKIIDYTLAGQLLLSITSDCYDEMWKIEGFKGLFEQLCLLKRPAMNHFFISLNTENVPRIRDEAKSYCIGNHITYSIDLEDYAFDELNCLVALALRMTTQQILSINHPIGIALDYFYSNPLPPKRTDFELRKYVLYKALRCVYPSYNLNDDLAELYYYALYSPTEDHPFFDQCLTIALKFCKGLRIRPSLSLFYLEAFTDTAIAKTQQLGNDVKWAYELNSDSLFTPSLRVMEKFSVFFGLPPLFHKCQTTGKWYYIIGDTENPSLWHPFKVALARMAAQQTISEGDQEAISAASFDFIELCKSGTEDFDSLALKALEIIDSGKPLLFLRETRGHITFVVIHNEDFYSGDRGFAPSTVIVQKLTRPVDSLFLQKLIEPLSDFEQLLPEYTSDSEIIRSLGAQYAGNCSVQSWLLGLWTIFRILGVGDDKFRELSRTARQSLWEEALKDKNLIPSMLMASINQPFGNPFTYSIDRLEERQQYKLLTHSRRAFFAHYFQIIRAVDIVDDTTLTQHSIYARKLDKRNNTKTNGSEILLKLNDVPLCAENVYLKVLSRCLLNQGEGVRLLLQDFQKMLGPNYEMEKSYLRLCKLAGTSQYTLVEAMIYSAVRHNVPIDPLEFEAVWELAFGTNWRTMPVNRFRRDFPSRRLIQFKTPLTAKSMFYALLFLDRVAYVPWCQVHNILMMLEERMFKEFPPLEFVNGIIIDSGSYFSEFPFHMLNLIYRVLMFPPSHYTQMIGWIPNLSNVDFHIPFDWGDGYDAHMDNVVDASLEEENNGVVYENSSDVLNLNTDIEPADNPDETLSPEISFDKMSIGDLSN